MCIFSMPVKVNKTKIVAWAVSETVQMTAYSNKIANEYGSKTIMVVAVPNPETIVFHDIEAFAKSVGCPYLDIFTQIEKCYAEAPTTTLYHDEEEEIDMGGGLNMYGSQTLKVEKTGPYTASVVPSINHFCRLDRTEFPTAINLNETLRGSYVDTPKIGFIVFKLGEEADKNYPPIFYTHVIDNKNIYIPTFHIHPTPKTVITLHDFVDDWDHEITIINGAQLGNDNIRRSLHNGKFPTMILGLFGFGNTKFVNLTTYYINGKFKNKDIQVFTDFETTRIFNPFEYAARKYPFEFEANKINYSGSIASFNLNPSASYNLNLLKRFDPDTGRSIAAPEKCSFYPKTGNQLAAAECAFDPITGKAYSAAGSNPYDQSVMQEFMYNLSNTATIKFTASPDKHNYNSSNGIYETDGDY